MGSGSRFDEVLTPTTRVTAPDRGQEHHRLERHSPCRQPHPRKWRLPSRVVWAAARHQQTTDLMVTRSLLLGVGCSAWRPARKMWMPNWNESSVEMRASSGQDEPARLP